MTRRGLAVVVALVLAAGAIVPASAAGAGAAPQVGELEEILPPGARQVVAVIRIIDGLAARNRVYREAGAVQRDLRAYYDARIATAQEMLLDRSILDLQTDRSQLRAYWRLRAKLEAERDLAMQITEDEKRAAKYGFESTLRRELLAAVVRIPRVQAGLGRLRDTVTELQTAVRQAQTALEGGNPVADALADVQAKLADVEGYGELIGLISGPTGNAIGSITGRVRRVVDQLQGPIDQARDAAGQMITELDGFVVAVDAQITPARTPRGGLDIPPDATASPDQFTTIPQPGPAGDAIADATARRSIRDGGLIDPTTGAPITSADLNRMIERVHAARLGNTLERIGQLCGRITGAQRRAQLDAAATGTPPPVTASNPCTWYGNADALQALIDSNGFDTDDESTTSEPDVAEPDQPAAPPAPAPTDDDFVLDGTYVGEIDFLSAYQQLAPEIAAQLTVTDNEMVAEFSDGELVVLLGGAHTAHPIIYRDDGGTCGSDRTWTFEGDVATYSGTDGGFELMVEVHEVGMNLCAEAGWSDEEIDDTYPLKGVGTVGSGGRTISLALTWEGLIGFPAELELVE